MQPLYSKNIINLLKALFSKPDAVPFETLPPVCQLRDPDAAQLPEFFAYLNRGFGSGEGAFSHDLGWHMRRDGHPLPIDTDREGYYSGHPFEWWCSGLVTFLKVAELYEKYTNKPLGGGDTYFEIGSASGRVLRHALLQPEEPLRVIGCDINARHVDWLRAFLPPKMRIFQNTTLPSLPLADAGVDIVCGFSVFTHVDNLEFGWLMELERVLRPGGIAFLTVHSDLLWDRLGNDPRYQGYANMFSTKYSLPYKRTRDTFQRPMPLPRMTFYDDEQAMYNTDMFHHREYLFREWGRFFAVRDIIPEAVDMQDLVVLQKEIF